MKVEVCIFWDHVMGSREPMKCTVIGFVYSEEENFIVYNWWEPLLENKDEADRNREFITILKSTIIKRFKISLSKALLQELQQHQ